MQADHKEDGSMKKTTGKTYAGIVLVAILVLFLANPRWLPVSQSLKESLE